MGGSLCDAEQQHDPKEESDWRAIQFPGEERAYYICPAHFPEDGARADDFRDAYVAVVLELAKRRGWSETKLGDALLGLSLS